MKKHFEMVHKKIQIIELYNIEFQCIIFVSHETL